MFYSPVCVGNGSPRLWNHDVLASRRVAPFGVVLHEVATIDGRKAFELMDEIPDVYKEVLIMRFVDGLGPKEMSELIEEKENVISVRIHRGLKLLRQKIEAQDEFADEKRKATARKKIANPKYN